MSRTRIISLTGTSAENTRVACAMVGTMGLIPMRAPHHSASKYGMADECRLAIGGVLYLPDAAEFGRQSIAAVSRCLREGSKCGPAIVVLDCSPLEGVGISEVSSAVKAMHRQRHDNIRASLVEGAEAYPA